MDRSGDLGESVFHTAARLGKQAVDQSPPRAQGNGEAGPWGLWLWGTAIQAALKSQGELSRSLHGVSVRTGNETLRGRGLPILLQEKGPGKATEAVTRSCALT